MLPKIKVAIDGPAASGKSTTAREVAKRLKYLYIDSGAMYRAVTLKALQLGVPTTAADKVAEIAGNVTIEFKQNDLLTEIFMDGKDVSKAIRFPKVTQNINPVAANPLVRKILVEKQKLLGKDGGVVMDGRDITTVVFPDAELKIFMKASAEERARRRVNELEKNGVAANFKKVLEEIENRDQADFTRKHSPLTQAPDAVVIDTTRLSIEEQVEEIYQLAFNIINQKKAGTI